MKWEKLIAEVITSLLIMLWAFGFVWLYAWVCNPNIDSGMVCFIGLIYGGICSSIGGTERRLRERR